MSVRSTAQVFRFSAVLAVAAAAGVGIAPGFTGQADAAASKSAHHGGKHSSPTAKKALKIAKTKKGSPYRFGAEGPKAFDCSGLTMYVYKKAGIKLPRTAAQQYQATWHIPTSRKLPGDLIFFGSGANKHHVGVYAGHGKMWDAPHTGSQVHLRKVYPGSVSYGRPKGGWKINRSHHKVAQGLTSSVTRTT